MNDKNDSEDSIENAEEIIERFGGIRPMANKMNVPVTTVQGWKKRNVIPGNRRDQVIEAAQSNDIDLSDIVSGAANENAAAPNEAPPTLERGEAVAEKTARVEPGAPTGGDPIRATKRRTAVATEPQSTNEELMGQIRRAQSMAFSRSAWFSVILVAFVVGISAMLLWPTRQQIEQNGQDIARLQGDMRDVKKGQSFLRGLIPDDIEARFSQMQAQTRDIQDRVTRLSTQAQQIAHDAVDSNTSLNTKIGRISDDVKEMGAPVELTGMLDKIRDLEGSTEGQTQLSGAVQQLNALFSSVKGGGEENIQAALEKAQQGNDALGQTLQGVSPEDLKAASLLIGLSQMRSSLNRSAPFGEDLALMEKTLHTENDPELQAAIDRLAPKAESGVLTPEGLKDQFKGLAGDIVVSSLKGEDVSVQEKARARLNNLIQVEKDGELITGTDTQATVARAQKQLDAGDIQGAIATLQALDGEAATTAQPFVDNAQMTLLAQQLQEMLTNRVIHNVGGSDISVRSGGMSQLINEIKKMAPQRAVVRDEESGFAILPPKPKRAP